MKEIENRLLALGYTNLRWDTSKTVSVMTDENRVSVLEHIAKEFSDFNAKYGPWGQSSVGSVKMDGFTIRARPNMKQGRKAPGLENEETLLRTLAKALSDSPITVKITDGTKTKSYRDVTKALASGYDTKNRKKADIILVTKTGRKIPISIKKQNADAWESADVLWGETAMKVIDREVKQGGVKLVKAKRPGAFALSKNIAVKASPDEKKQVVFGSDILGKGFVVINTFTSDNFSLKKNILRITVHKIIDSVNDLCNKYEIFFLVRNNLSRNARKMVPGLRAQAVQATRITRNTLVVPNI